MRSNRADWANESPISSRIEGVIPTFRRLGPSPGIAHPRIEGLTPDLHHRPDPRIRRKMTNVNSGSRLSSFEWFSLISGVVSLAANILYLATFAPPPAAVVGAPSSAVRWVLLFGLLCYSLVAIDVLVMRLITRRRARVYSDRVSHAQMALVLLLGVPPMTAFLVASARILRRYDPLALVNLWKDDNYTPTVLDAYINWAIESLVLGVALTMLLGLAAHYITEATLDE